MCGRDDWDSKGGGGGAGNWRQWPTTPARVRPFTDVVCNPIFHRCCRWCNVHLSPMGGALELLSTHLKRLENSVKASSDLYDTMQCIFSDRALSQHQQLEQRRHFTEKNIIK